MQTSRHSQVLKDDSFLLIIIGKKKRIGLFSILSQRKEEEGERKKK